MRRVNITHIRKGVFLPRAKEILFLVADVTQDEADKFVNEMSLHNVPAIVELRKKYKQDDWDVFTGYFESYQLPTNAQLAPSENSGEPDDKLKLFKVTISYDAFYTVLILATDKQTAQAAACFAVDEDWDYEIRKGTASVGVKEIKSFKNGQVLSVVED